MRVPLKKLIVIAVMAGVILTGAFNYCFAGAWTPPEGKLYNKLSVNSYAADRYFDNDGNKKTWPITENLPTRTPATP